MQSFLLVIGERPIDGLELVIMVLAHRTLSSVVGYVRVSSCAEPEGRLARPHEVTRIRLLDLGIARLRESKPQRWTFAPPHVDRYRRDEIEIVHMKPEDAQESRELRKIASNDPLQVRHSAAAPVFKMLRGEQV